jgi:hypothetical protein
MIFKSFHFLYFLLFIFISALSFQSICFSQEKRIYLFSWDTLSCEGLNKTGWGECTDLSRIDFQLSRNRIRIERRRTNLIGSSLVNRDLSRTRFRSARLRFVDFRNANLRNVVFDNTDLRGADFRGADLSGAQFLGKISLNGAKFNQKTILTTLSDTDGRWGREFALNQHMIFNDSSTEVSGEHEIEGYQIKQVNWDATLNQGTLILSVFESPETLALPFRADIYSIVNQIELDRKVKVTYTASRIVDLSESDSQ